MKLQIQKPISLILLASMFLQSSCNHQLPIEGEGGGESSSNVANEQAAPTLVCDMKTLSIPYQGSTLEITHTRKKKNEDTIMPSTSMANAGRGTGISTQQSRQDTNRGGDTMSLKVGFRARNVEQEMRALFRNAVYQLSITAISQDSQGSSSKKEDTIQDQQCLIFNTYRNCSIPIPHSFRYVFLRIKGSPTDQSLAAEFQVEDLLIYLNAKSKKMLHNLPGLVKIMQTNASNERWEHECASEDGVLQAYERDSNQLSERGLVALEPAYERSCNQPSKWGLVALGLVGVAAAGVAGGGYLFLKPKKI